MTDTEKTIKRLANLKHGNPETQFKSGRSAVENGRKGGIQLGINNAKKRLLSEEILKAMSADDWETICKNLVERAKDDNTSLQLLRDTIGQRPSDRAEVNVTGVSLETFLTENETD